MKTRLAIYAASLVIGMVFSLWLGLSVGHPYKTVTRYVTVTRQTLEADSLKQCASLAAANENGYNVTLSYPKCVQEVETAFHG